MSIFVIIADFILSCNSSNERTPTVPVLHLPVASSSQSAAQSPPFRWDVLEDSKIVRPSRDAVTVLTFSRDDFSSSECKTLEGSSKPEVDCTYRLKKSIKTCPQDMKYVTLKEAMNIKESLRNLQLGALFTTVYDRQVCDKSSSATYDSRDFPANCQTMFRAQQVENSQCYWTSLWAMENSSFALKYYEQSGEGDFCFLEYTKRKAVLLADAHFLGGEPVFFVYDICFL